MGFFAFSLLVMTATTAKAAPFCSGFGECSMHVVGENHTTAARPTDPLRCDPPPAAIEHGDRDYKRAAITFDACSSGQFLFDESVYATIERMRLRATIFLGGEWVQKQSRVARRIANNPLLEVAMHSYHHPHLPTLTPHQIADEMRDAQWAIFRELGIWPHLFRAPYGELNASTLQVAQNLGVTIVQYDLPSGDPDPALKPDAIVRWVVDSAKNGSIVVFHINKNGVHTAETLPEVIRQLRARSFELVTVSELLGAAPTFTDGATCLDPREGEAPSQMLKQSSTPPPMGKPACFGEGGAHERLALETTR